VISDIGRQKYFWLQEATQRVLRITLQELNLVAWKYFYLAIILAMFGILYFLLPKNTTLKYTDGI
jgi:hypothetical protein